MIMCAHVQDYDVLAKPQAICLKSPWKQKKVMAIPLAVMAKSFCVLHNLATLVLIVNCLGLLLQECCNPLYTYMHVHTALCVIVHSHVRHMHVTCISCNITWASWG